MADRLAPGSTDASVPVRIVFLGGLGEIGRNCMAIEQGAADDPDRTIILIDCGLMFPDAATRDRLVDYERRTIAEAGRWRAGDAGPQGSGILTSMTRANGYAIIPADAGNLDPGATVACQWMHWD